MTDRELFREILKILDKGKLVSTPKEHTPQKITLAFQTKEWFYITNAITDRLAQPEPAECDGGQCGIGGYCKQCPKPLVKLKEMLEVQGRDGTWNYDHYLHGMYNGMEVMLAVLEGREPAFRKAPEKWLSKKEWVGLTEQESGAIMEELDAYGTRLYEFARAIEAKLKEKNT